MGKKKMLRENGHNPQTKCKKIKEDIKEMALKIIGEERKRPEKQIRV